MHKYILLTFLLFIFAITFFAYPVVLYVGSASTSQGITSPLPNFLTGDFLKPFYTLPSWKPNTDKVLDKGIPKPQIYSDAAISYDITTDTLLYSKNIKKKLPIASLTKIATAIIAIENIDIDKDITISEKAANVGENSMGLTSGEKLKLKDLLYGLILLSGNDAAEAIAEGSRFGRDNFVYLMNKKVEDLGLTDTHFTNPSGLEGDGQQYGTAYDLLVLTNYALQNSVFAEVVSTVNYDIPYTDDHKAFFMFNETNLLTSYPGVKGVKTGYTFEAGLCLVTYLEHNGHKIITVLLNSQNRRQEMKDLLDYSLKTLGVTPPPHR